MGRSWVYYHNKEHNGNMAILELKLQSTYFNQECVNVFAYQSTGTPAAVTLSFALISAFGCIPDTGVYPTGSVFEAIRALQSSSVSYDIVVARDLYSVVDFYETPFNPAAAGIVSGTVGMSPADAYGFRSSRVRSDIKRGTKRFVGVPEGAVTGGGIIESASLTAMGTLATRMGQVLSYDDEGNTLSFAPVILGRQRYDPETGDPDPEGTAYRYYPTFTEQNAFVAAGIAWDAYNQVRTQTSRQYGRGR
jgi:hypothetical protein